jgi:toxin ParE1/3/4
VKQRSVMFSPEARDDIAALYLWIAQAADPHTALRYIERLERFCMKLELAAERGQSRDDLRPGLRIVGFERRLTLAFAVADDTVQILRIFATGRHWEDAFKD